MVADIIAHIVWLGGIAAWTYFEIDIYLYQRRKNNE